MKSKRTFALLIDMLIVSQLLFLIERFVDLTIYSGEFEIASIVFVQKFSLHAIFFFIYFVLMDLFTGSSLGKKVMKIKTVSTDLTKVGSGVIIGRNLLKMISLIFLPIAGIVYLINGSTLQDYFCKTVTTEVSPVL